MQASKKGRDVGSTVHPDTICTVLCLRYHQSSLRIILDYASERASYSLLKTIGCNSGAFPHCLSLSLCVYVCPKSEEVCRSLVLSVDFLLHLTYRNGDAKKKHCFKIFVIQNPEEPDLVAEASMFLWIRLPAYRLLLPFNSKSSSCGVTIVTAVYMGRYVWIRAPICVSSTVVFLSRFSWRSGALAQSDRGLSECLSVDQDVKNQCLVFFPCHALLGWSPACNSSLTSRDSRHCSFSEPQEWFVFGKVLRKRSCSRVERQVCVRK